MTHWRTFLPLPLLLVASAALASLNTPTSPEQLVRESHRIVIGTVTTQKMFWNEAHDRIHTEFTIQVDRNLKGDPERPVSVRILGGHVGDRELVVSGTPKLEVGEKVLLFLKDRIEFHAVTHMALGKWSIRTIDGVEMVSQGPALGTVVRQPGERELIGFLKELGLSAQEVSHE